MITTTFILFTLYRFSDFNNISSFSKAFDNINEHLVGPSKPVVPIQNEVVLPSESITSLEDKEAQFNLDEGDKLTSSEEEEGKKKGFYKILLISGVVIVVGICLIGGGYYLFQTGGAVASSAEVTQSLVESAEDIAEVTQALGESSGDMVEVAKTMNSIVEMNDISAKTVSSSIATLDEAAKSVLDLGEYIGKMTNTLDKLAQTFMTTAQELSDAMEEARCSKFLEGSWLDPSAVGAKGATKTSTSPLDLSRGILGGEKARLVKSNLATRTKKHKKRK